jgi:hypothetical protein
VKLRSGKPYRGGFLCVCTIEQNADLRYPHWVAKLPPFPEVGIVRDERMFQVKTFFRAEVVLAQRAVRAFSSSER